MYSTNEMKQANRIAMNWLYSDNNLLFNRKFKCDMRTRIGKLAYSIVRKQANSINKAEILAIRKNRRIDKRTHSNILSNPIVVDYLANKSTIVVYPNCLTQGGRNHWAKCDKDRNILAILAKY